MAPAALHAVEIGGVRIQYLDKGQGPALLMIHGLGATHADWHQQIDLFASHFRVIAPDLRGHGGSAAGGVFSIPALAADMMALLERLGVDAFRLMGHSMGGAVAMQLALANPQRVSRLVLADTLPSFVPNSLEKRWMYWTRCLAMALLGPVRLTRLMAERAFPDPAQSALRDFLLAHNGRTPKRVYLALIKALSRWDVRDQLIRLTLPVLVIAGDRDYFAPSEAEAFARQLPDGRCRLVSGAGHHLPLEKPVAFNHQTLSFLLTTERG